jgi:predicted transposase/invertase (TIGR01784 family)
MVIRDSIRNEAAHLPVSSYLYLSECYEQMSSLKDKYINSLTDFGFKKLFGSEPNKELLIDFLNQVLPERHRIAELTYAKNEQLPANELDRKAIFDLYCQATTGERFVVEMQKAKQNFFKDRSVYYASFPIQDQAQQGKWDYRLDPVYTVGILDFVFDDHKQEPALLHLVELKNQRCEVFFDKLKFIYLELPKFTKSEDQLETQLDKWLFVLRHVAKLQDRPQALQDRVFERLFAAAEIARFTPAEKEAYEESLKYYRDLKNVVDTSWEEGRVEGKAEGLEEGVRQVARQMKAEREPIENIMRFTGLSRGEIEGL